MKGSIIRQRSTMLAKFMWIGLYRLLPNREYTLQFVMTMNKLLLGAIPLLLCACGSTGVYPVGGGVYYVSQRSWQLELGYTPLTKAAVINEAEAFCADKGKNLAPVELEVRDSALMTNGRVSMTFRCANKDN